MQRTPFALAVLASALLVVSIACDHSPTGLPVERDSGSLTAATDRWVNVCYRLRRDRVVKIHVPKHTANTLLRHGLALPEELHPVAVTASSYGTGPDYATDGDLGTSWNSLLYPVQWIELDLGSPRWFSRIEATVDQLPDGTTNHDVTFDGSPAFSWTGYTSAHQTLTYDFPSLQYAQKVRITTTSSPSWVAWWEIRILGC